VSPKNFEDNNLAAAVKDVKQISSAVMGIAEFVVDIRFDLKAVKEVVQKKSQRSGSSTLNIKLPIDFTDTNRGVLVFGVYRRGKSLFPL